MVSDYEKSARTTRTQIGEFGYETKTGTFTHWPVVPSFVRLSGVVKRAGFSAVVSVATSAVGLMLLATLVYLNMLESHAATVVASCVMIGPTYVLNRRFVWGKLSRSSLRKEIGPFWLLGLTTIALTAAVVRVLEQHFEGVWSSPLQRTFVVTSADVSVGVAMWGVQFWLLERYLFKSSTSEHQHT